MPPSLKVSTEMHQQVQLLLLTGNPTNLHKVPPRRPGVFLSHYIYILDRQLTGGCSSKVSLSGLLNALDGIGAQEGRILFATTNKYSSLDPALCRPGRMDIHIEFKLASKFQAGQLYRCFYLAEDDKTAPHVRGNAGKEGSDLDSESSSEVDVDLIDLDTNGVQESKTAASTLEAKVAVSGHFHRADLAVSRISQGRILKLADQFEDAIPEREFSMASLQGYLMGYKTRPINAVRDVASWIEKEKAERAAKMVVAETPRGP